MYKYIVSRSSGVIHELVLMFAWKCAYVHVHIPSINLLVEFKIITHIIVGLKPFKWLPRKQYS
jgi:hypothetical protein